jgi:hypothetical protein
MSGQNIRITEHAVERFQERIEVVPTSDAAIKAEIRRCLTTAKPKHFRDFGKNTYYIPTDRCVFVCSRDAIVTVLKRRDGPRSASAPHETWECCA